MRVRKVQAAYRETEKDRGKFAIFQTACIMFYFFSTIYKTIELSASDVTAREAAAEPV